MGTRQADEGDGGNAASQLRVKELHSEIERKQQELDELLLRSETLHPSAYGTMQGQLEEEMETLQAELKSLTTVAG